MNEGYFIILDPTEIGQPQLDMNLRGRVCYLDFSSGRPEFLHVDQGKRWSQEGDPAWERANSDYPEVRMPTDVIEDIRYELGLCTWKPRNPDKAVRFIDIEGNYMDGLEQLEHDLNIRLDRSKIVSDVSVLWSYKERVKTPKGSESAETPVA